MKKQKRGTRTKDAVPDILERVSRGESLRSACEANGLDPSGSGFLQMVREDEALAQQYARAHEIGVDCQVGEMQDLERRVLSGEIDPQAFKAALDSRKWRWARQAAKKYGDKLGLEHSGKIALTTEQTDAALAAAGLLPPKRDDDGNR